MQLPKCETTAIAKKYNKQSGQPHLLENRIGTSTYYNNKRDVSKTWNEVNVFPGIHVNENAKKENSSVNKLPKYKFAYISIAWLAHWYVTHYHKHTQIARAIGTMMMLHQYFHHDVWWLRSLMLALHWPNYSYHLQGISISKTCGLPQHCGNGNSTDLC